MKEFEKEESKGDQGKPVLYSEMTPGGEPKSEEVDLSKIGSS